MRSGRLRHRIEIKQESDAQNDYGAPTGELETITTTKANVQVLSGSEQARQGIVVTSEAISVLMRQNSAVDYDRLISWKGFDYSIVTIKPSDDDRQIVVTAQREL